MNKVVLMGRLTRDPEIRYSTDGTAIASYNLAVDRRTRGENNADFIGCVAFGKSAEFVEKYLRQGTKVAIVGRIQTGSYTNREGKKVYTVNVVAEEHEFAESKRAETAPAKPASAPASEDGFMKLPDGIDEELPFA